MLRNVLVTLLEVISFFLAMLGIGFGLSAAISVLWIIGSLFSAVLKLIGFDMWADFETALYGLFGLLIFATGCAVSFKICDWLDPLTKRIERRG